MLARQRGYVSWSIDGLSEQVKAEEVLREVPGGGREWLRFPKGPANSCSSHRMISGLHGSTPVAIECLHSQ